MSDAFNAPSKDDARASIGQLRAAVAVWSNYASTADLADGQTASNLQTLTWTFLESLDHIKVPAGGAEQPVIAARALLRMIDGTLWDYVNDGAVVGVNVGELGEAAKLAASQLARAEMTLALAVGLEPTHA